MWGSIFSTDFSNLISMVPLSICSVLVLAIVLERLVNFRPSKFYNEDLSEEVITLISNGKRTEALERVASKNSIQEKILHDGMIDCYEKNVLPEIAFLDHGLSKLEVLAKWLPVLNFIAKVAPLLGLLGTVLGMIDAFEVIASSADSGAVKPELVAQGIGTALITTASGLIVAIPALISSSVLTRMAQKVYNQMDDSLKSITIASGGLQVERKEEKEKTDA